VQQIVVPSVGERWFDPGELRAAAIARNGTAGAACQACGNWRWMPVPSEQLPPPRVVPDLGEVDIAASPEWFGDGWNCHREILVRRELAELIVAVSSRDFTIREVL